MKSIMIVDDEALVLFDMVMTVEDLGYEVFCDCTSLSDAFDCLGDGSPHAALLDIDVGGTMVWPLARELKSRGALVIFLSANRAHEELRTEFAECSFIDKPASADEIDTVLTENFNRQGAPGKLVANRA